LLSEKGDTRVFFFSKGKEWVGAVAHACNNPSYLEGQDWYGQGSRSTQAKINETPISTSKKLGTVAYICHPNYTRSIERTEVQARMGINSPQNN
jgi:hypothetical protein